MPESAGSYQTLFSIYIRLVTGETCTFAIDDPTQAKAVLEDMHPGRLFSAPHLMLGGDASLTFLPTEHVERVMLIGSDIPSWPYLAGAKVINEISDEEFKQAYDPEMYTAHRADVAKAPGSQQTGFTEFWMKSGVKRYWEVWMESLQMTQMDVKPYIQSMFKAGGLHAMVDGGVAIINPANIVRMTFHPGPITLPSGAWAARRV